MKSITKRTLALFLAVIIGAAACSYNAAAGESSSRELVQGKLYYAQALLQAAKSELKAQMQPYLEAVRAVTEEAELSEREAETQMETLDMIIDTIHTYEDAQDNGTETEEERVPVSGSWVNADNGSADLSALKGAIQNAQQILPGNYTDKSYEALTKILAAARLAETISLSQEMADIYTSAVNAAVNALVEKAEEDDLPDGTYSIPSIMKHANNRQDSMGNAALKKPSLLIVKDGKGTLQLDFVSLSIALGTGYLGEFYYLTYDKEDYPPTGSKTYAPSVTAYYEGVYDAYNNPENGIDAQMKGKLYPKTITMPVEIKDEEIWVQVYVPIMEGISAGAGKQYARLQLDFENMVQKSGQGADVSVLNAMISQAKGIQQSAVSDELYGALQASVAAAQELSANLNATQAQIDAQTEALKCSVETITGRIAITDKTVLQTKITEADSYLSKTTVYTAASLSSLKSAIQKAEAVNMDLNASQAQIDGQITLLQQSVSALVKLADKTVLEQKIKAAQDYMKQTDVYTQDSLNALSGALEGAKKIYDKTQAIQSEADEVVKSLNSAISNLEKKKTVDKSGLKKKLEEAEKLSGKTSVYTASTLKALNTVKNAAQAVYDSGDSSQTSVDAQTAALTAAIGGLKKTTDEVLDYKNLKDGIYSVYTDMIKVDRVSKSMANEAINHTIKLTVENGVYELTLDFTGLKINGSYGFLSRLKYYTEGYTYDSIGNPQGKLKEVTVLTTQKDSDGKVVVDSYNDESSPYPDTVKFELSATALEDENGFVPLQVFVPIMDAISAGTGTQNVLMKLDWSTLKATTEEDPALQPKDPEPQSPAFDQTVNGVRIAADKGLIAEGANAEVTQITQGDEYTSAKTALTSVFSSFQLYKIILTQEGSEIQPEGFITISIPLGSISSTKAGVYRINDDGTKSLLAGTVENNLFVFKTNKMGLFAIGEKSAASTLTPNKLNTVTPNTVTPKSSTGASSVKTASNAKTADESPAVIMMILLLASLGMVSFLLNGTRKRRRDWKR